MSVTYKDIDDLSQKSSVAGTEKLPVSDTEYITPDQIANNSTITVQMNGATVDSFTTNASSAKTINLGGTYPKCVTLADESDLPASPDSNTLYAITSGVVNIVYLVSEALMPATPDSNTLYIIKEQDA